MNREQRQRGEEVEAAQRFFHRHFGAVPEFEDLPTNSVPDLCALFEGKRIGIELTKALDPNAAARDSFTESVLRTAKLRHEALDGLPGRVTVSLRHNYNPGHHQRNHVGDALGDLVATLWASLEGVTIIRPDAMPPVLAELLTEVRAFATEATTSTHWDTVTAGSVQPINNERLQPIIDNKNRKLADYRKMGCDELWLLIYARPLKPAESWDAATGFYPAQLQSSFDRTFFCDFWRSIELGAGSVSR